MRIAGEILDRANGDARDRQVHQELCQPCMFIVGIEIRAEERNHVVRVVRIRRPELGAVHYPATVCLFCFCARRSQIGATVGLAHTDAEEEVPLGCLRQDHLALFFSTKAQQQLPALPVADPMGTNGRTSCQHFFQHHVAFQGAAFMTAIFFWPGHADPTFGTEFF